MKPLKICRTGGLLEPTAPFLTTSQQFVSKLLPKKCSLLNNSASYVYNFVLKTVIVLNVALIQYSVVGFFRLIRLAEDWPLERFSTYSLFVDLLDNYNPQLNELEPEPTEEEKAEINRFMLQMENYSMVMNELTDFLLEKSKLL